MERTVDAHLVEYLISETISLLSNSATHSLQLSSLHRTQHQERLHSSDSKPNPTSDQLPPKPNQLEIDQGFRSRFDQAGYRVGWALAERLAKDKPRIPRSTQSVNQPSQPGSPDPLEVIKFICKDLWSALYNKQADNLRTNHRGVFVIQDYGFRPFLRLSAPMGYEAELDKICQKMLIFPLAVIRGALMNLGIQSIVSAEVGVPQCTFQIRTAAATSSNQTSSLSAQATPPPAPRTT